MCSRLCSERIKDPETPISHTGLGRFVTISTRFWRRNRVELAHLNCPGHVFPKHFHEEYVIGVNTSGFEKIWISGKQAAAGLTDVTLYNPGEVQTSHAAGPDWSFVSLYIEPSYVSDMFGSSRDLNFTQSVLQNALFANNLRNGVLEALVGDVDAREIEEFIILITSGLFRHAADMRGVGQSSACQTIVRRVAEEITEGSASIPSIDDLAQAHGLPPVQLLRMFKKVHGMPPFQWGRVHRLHTARRALLGGESLAEISYAHGFADQSHFTREFRKMFATTPAAYRRSMK